MHRDSIRIFNQNSPTADLELSFGKNSGYQQIAKQSLDQIPL